MTYMITYKAGSGRTLADCNKFRTRAQAETKLQELDMADKCHVIETDGKIKVRHPGNFGGQQCQ